jgi:hypothetical protein
MEWEVTDKMIEAAQAAFSPRERSPYVGIYCAMRTADPLAAAERAVVEAAVAWAGEEDGSRLVLDRAVHELLRLRAAVSDR